MSHHVLASVVALAIALPLGASGAQDTTAAATADSMVTMRAASVQWAPVNTPGFEPGLEIGVLSGNPTAAGPYTLRLRFPDGYVFPAHWHPQAENLTVISGRFFLGMGERSEDGALEAYAPGDFLSVPARMPHYGRVEGETVIQLHGQGPFEINVVGQAPGGARR